MEKPDEDAAERGEGIGRRRFLNWSWKVLGAGLAVEAGWTTYDILVPRPSGAFGGVVEAGTADQFPEGTVRYFLSGRFYVTSYQGVLVALYQKCPHLGCRVPFCDSSKRFECPCHGSAFNIKGEYVQGPSPRGMDRFPVRIDGDQVLVDTSSVIEGSARGVMTGPSEPAGASCLEADTQMDDLDLGEVT
jgi:cytochrome b6-f complex iron-sulfur subunit